MRLKTLLSTGLLCITASAFAQTGPWRYDSVALGAGYANDIFYGIQQGTTTQHAGNDWDLGFQISAISGRDVNFYAAVRASHAKKQVQVYVLRDSASYKWASVAPADTVGKTAASMQLYNNDTSWGTGAFYQNHLVADPFSFGWGNYSLNDHSITGDNIYLVKMGGNAYKIWIQKYVSTPSDSASYAFRIAKLDGTNDNTIKFNVKANGFSNRMFAYYDITTNSMLNREPLRETWDFLFTQYVTMVPGPSGLQAYPVMGLLTNLETEVAKVGHLNPDDVTVTNYKGLYQATHSHLTDAIGYSWKTYVNPGPNGYYQLEDSSSYIIKTVATTQEYWQLQFIRFDGSSTGKIVFRKRYIEPTAVTTIAAQALNAFAVSPNPASADATLMLDAKKAAAAQMIVTDMAGRVMQTTSLNLKGGVNAYSLNTASWPAGIYAVQVAAQDWKVSSRLVVAH